MALLATSILFAALFNAGKSKRIVGGQSVTADEYPFIVSVGGYCGGSLLRKEHQAVILTAAHCIGSSNITVTFDGDFINDPNGITKQVSSVIVNPNYNPSTMDNDIALLFIDEDLNEYEQLETVNINPLSSDTSECCSTGDDLTVIGYGADYEEGPATLTLEYVDIDYLSQAECQNNDTNRYPNGKITNSTLCAETSEKDTCEGDSGGPLIKKGSNEQVGIVSWGWGCARYPGVYTNIGIPSIYNWIQTTINNERSRIPWLDCFFDTSCVIFKSSGMVIPARSNAPKSSRLLPRSENQDAEEINDKQARPCSPLLISWPFCLLL